MPSPPPPDSPCDDKPSPSASDGGIAATALSRQRGVVEDAGGDAVAADARDVNMQLQVEMLKHCDEPGRHPRSAHLVLLRSLGSFSLCSNISSISEVTS